MVFEQIEKLKQQYTDQYVLVDAARPELARFRDTVGQVRTVNMSGRALVEFVDYHLNIGWYDIELEFLKVVDKPPPKVEKKEVAKKGAAKAATKGPPAAKPAGSAGKKLSPLEMARMQGAAKKNPSAAKPKGAASVADVLAAARAEKGGGTAPASPAKQAKPGAGETATAKPTAKPQSTDRAKMSVADMLAAARAEKGAEAPQAPQEATAAVPQDVPHAAEEDTAAEAQEAEPTPTETSETADAPPVSTDTRPVDKTNMSVDQILAWCREHDGG